jgi:hypothetical protein
LCAAIAGAAQAYKTFITPGNTSKDYKAGDTATLAGISSHYFAVGEKIEPPGTVEMYVCKNGAISYCRLAVFFNILDVWAGFTNRQTCLRGKRDTAYPPAYVLPAGGVAEECPLRDNYFRSFAE